MDVADKITVKYQSIDGYNETRKYKTLNGARRFAQKWVGKHPEISENFRYAISADGIGKITCFGCTVKELFPESNG